MAERRSKIQVLVDILRVIQREGGETKPTHILYKANLSHKLLKTHLKALLDGQFIEQKSYGDKTYYAITDKGISFVAEYRKIEKLSSAFGLPI